MNEITGKDIVLGMAQMSAEMDVEKLEGLEKQLKEERAFADRLVELVEHLSGCDLGCELCVKSQEVIKAYRAMREGLRTEFAAVHQKREGLLPPGGETQRQLI